MMNGFIGSPGGTSILKSGTSFPPHFLPFQEMSFRFGSHGLPLGSTEARLYMTRRFAGHEKAQFGVVPRPLGSLGSRRAIWLPFSVQHPAHSQLPLAVEPSS